LKEFPAELLAVASRVQSLELFMNNFTFLPPSISTFSSLTRLELMRNEITTLPGSFFSFFSKENIYIFEVIYVVFLAPRVFRLVAVSFPTYLLRS
jgi:Leucine-rich repeat (LRR) protein